MGFRLGDAVPFPEPGNPASFVHVLRAWRTRFAPNQIGIGQRARVVNSPKPNALPPVLNSKYSAKLSGHLALTSVWERYASMTVGKSERLVSSER